MKERYLEETNQWELEFNEVEDSDIFEMFEAYAKQNNIENNEENFKKLIETALLDVVNANK